MFLHKYVCRYSSTTAILYAGIQDTSDSATRFVTKRDLARVIVDDVFGMILQKNARFVARVRMHLS